MEFREIETDVTPGIKKTSLWAIIVILLIVVGVETTYIFTTDKQTVETNSDQLNQQPLDNTLGFSNTNPGEIITQSPQRIPTLIPNTNSPQNKNQTQKVAMNQQYFFPLKDAGGESVDDFEFVLIDYEFTNKVVVNNFYNATVNDTQKILAINIEINNDTEKAFNIIVRDYVRLSVNEKKWIAPEIHSDPVELRPQSSKTTVIGFPLNKSDNNLRLQIGEVDGEKELIDVSIN